jgi:hypothetical protein
MDTLVAPPNTQASSVENWYDEKQIFPKQEETCFTEAQVESIKKGIEQADKGLLTPHTEVRKKAREILCGN